MLHVNEYFKLQLQGVQGEPVDRELLYSDDDDDFSSAEEGSDSEPMLDDLQGPVHGSGGHLGSARRFRKGTRGMGSGGNGIGGGKVSSAAAQARQRNLKQKFVALLKKFKVTDPEDLEHEQVSLDQKLSGKPKKCAICSNAIDDQISLFAS